MLPYLLERLQRRLTQLRDEQRTSEARLWLRSLPVFLYYGSNFILYWLYLFLSPLATTDVLMLLAGIRYTRRGERDSSASTWLSPLGSAFFVLRFVQWWRENAADLQATASITPSAPTGHLQRGVNGMAIPGGDDTRRAGAGRCPLCKGPLRQPVALVSGLVFCQLCLDQHPRFAKDRRCPISALPTGHVAPRQIFVAPAAPPPPPSPDRQSPSRSPGNGAQG